MWILNYLIDNAYSDTGQRAFFVKQGRYAYYNAKGRLVVPRQEWYTVVEEWNTPESQGNTEDFNYYTFASRQSARVFIAELVRKFNSPQQRVILKGAYESIKRITALAPTERERVKKELKEEEERAQQQKEKQGAASGSKSVYVFLLDTERIKIGVSNNVSRRRQDIMQGSGMFIPKWCHTESLPENTAFEIESRCHRHFKENRIRGEFFKTPFTTACLYLQSLVKKPLVMCKKEET